MAQATPTHLPPHLLPRSKAPATSSSTTSLDTLGSDRPSHPSRAASRHRTASPINTSTDTSDKATTALIRRVLLPLYHGGLDPRPIDELLPPLTSSNEVDLQLYAIIAIVIKEFVYSWYSKITPDQTFVEEVVQIFAHCTRDLEQRLRRVDAASLLLDEIPALLIRHIRAYRTASQPQHLTPIPVDPREAYHALVPHPAFSPVPKNPESEEEQLAQETAYRQLLVQGILAVLLPTEDLNNPCLRTLVADVLGELILGKGIGGKACEGWLIWDGVTKIAASINAEIEPKATGQEIEQDTRSRLEKFGLLSEKGEDQDKAEDKGGSSRSSVISDVFWRILQYAYLTFATLRFIVAGLIVASSEPQRRHHTPKTLAGKDEAGPPMTSGVQAPAGSERPILAFSMFGLISEMLELSWRMPWVVGTLSLVQWHIIGLRVGTTNGLIDKFLSHLIHSYILPPSRLPALLLTLRTSLFPNNAMGPAREVPSLEEQRAIKRRAAESILDIVPRVAARKIFAYEGDVTAVSSEPLEHSRENDNEELAKAERVEKENLIAAVEEILGCFHDGYMNKHLIFGIVELVFVRLVPEIGEKSVSQLMEERGVEVGFG